MQKFINVRPEEVGQFTVLLLTVALTTASFEAANVVVTTGFVDQSGVQNVPQLMALNAIVTMGVSAGFALFADRVRRMRIIQGMLLLFAVLYLAARLVLTYDLISPALQQEYYGALYVFIEQVAVLFPLAFWAYANDLYNVAASKRLFPLLAGGALLGNALGNLFAGASTEFFTQQGRENVDLLIVCGLLSVLAFALISLGMRDEPSTRTKGQRLSIRGFREKQQMLDEDDDRRFKLSDTWKTGLDFVKDVPLFRFLALAIFLNWAVGAIAWYFLLDRVWVFTSFDPEGFQTFLGSFKAAATALTLPLQLFVAGRLSERFGLKNVFVVMPVTLLLGSLFAAFQQQILSAVLLQLGVQASSEAIDTPASQSVQGLVPDARRGRVGIFLDSYVYGAGTIFGSLVLIVVLAAERLAGLPPAVAVIIYQFIGGLLAGGAIYAALRIRQVYDASLLNWRLRRKKRGRSVNLSGLYDSIGD